MENEQQKKNQLIANTLGNIEKLIDETPLSRRDREAFIEGLKAIVDELNKAIAPPVEAVEAPKKARLEVEEAPEPYPHIVEEDEPYKKKD